MLPEDEDDEILDLPPHEDIIERNAPDEEPLWLWAQTCPMEDCPCRAVLVAAANSREQLDEQIPVVREAFDEAEDAAGFRAALPGDALVFELDIDSGDVSMPLDDAAELTPEVARIAERIDGDLLDRLASQWHHGKGHVDAASIAVEPEAIRDFQVGQLLAWDEVHEGARMDVYHYEGSAIEAIETYCVRPKCQCNDVHVQFYEIPIAEVGDEDEGADELSSDSHAKEHHEDEHVFIGTVSVKVEDPVQIAYRADQGEAGRLEALFRLYQARYPRWLGRLAERADRMAAFGEKLHAHLERKRKKPWVSSSQKRKGKRH